MKKTEKKVAVRELPGRVLGRVLAEELGFVRGGLGVQLAAATGTQTAQENGNRDFTGGRAGQSDGD